MIKFPELFNIPLAEGVDKIMDWLLLHLDGFFDAIGFIILKVVMAFEDVFLYIPWFVLVLLIGLAGWKLVRSLKMGIVFMILMMIIGIFGYWEWLCRLLLLLSHP
jgi:glycine betaine/proline transport system permease protein